MPKNSPFTAAQLAALNHYVETGRTSLLDGVEGREGRYSEHSHSPDVEQWRMDIPIAADKLTTNIRYDAPRSPVISVKPRRSIQPISSSCLGINSREEISQPRDISVWRLAIPPHCQPPDDMPWTSHVTESDDFEYEPKTVSVREPLESSESRARPIELKPGPDIHATPIPLSSTLQSSAGTSPEALHSWRYENFVDWWRSGLKADGEAHRLSTHEAEAAASRDALSRENVHVRMGPPSSHTSVSEHPAPVVSKRYSLSKPASRAHSIHTDRRTKALHSQPPPVPTGVIESPATTMEDYHVEDSTQESVTKVYYRLISGFISRFVLKPISRPWFFPHHNRKTVANSHPNPSSSARTNNNRNSNTQPETMTDSPFATTPVAGTSPLASSSSRTHHHIGQPISGH
ncbi:hypothetical protein FRC02_000546 [Tulasnella sp. 418]|nr:hypothetical protein FRC02_000546 [Tulasnella sp. 418]